MWRVQINFLALLSVLFLNLLITLSLAFPLTDAGIAADTVSILDLADEETASLQSMTMGHRRTKEDIIADARERWSAGILNPSGLEHFPSEFEFDSLETPSEAGLIRRNPATLPPPPPRWDPRNSSWASLCPSLLQVRDQGDCDGSWSAAVASAFSDRICIQAGGNVSSTISAQDILSCCGTQCGTGCSGGLASQAWTYLYQTGAVTGDAYNTTEPQAGCLPYSLPPCNLSSTLPCGPSFPSTTPVCDKQCMNGRVWESEKRFSETPYWILNDTSAIESEIYYNGPVTATMDLYEDLFHLMPHNIYRYSEGSFLGTLTVKIVGYGFFMTIPYWIVATTWGPNWVSFVTSHSQLAALVKKQFLIEQFSVVVFELVFFQGGDEGFFKMYKGYDECHIESRVMAAMVVPNDASSFMSSSRKLT